MSSEHEPLPNRRWSVVALFDSRPQITVAFPFENDYESTEFTRLLSDYLKLHSGVWWGLVSRSWRRFRGWIVVLSRQNKGLITNTLLVFLLLGLGLFDG